MDEALTTVRRDARIARVRKSADVGGKLSEGYLYAEVYLPFDPLKFAEFWLKVRALSTSGQMTDEQAAVRIAEAEPELARLALDPIDSQGEVMLQEDLVKMAEDFLVHSRKIDVYHDKQARPSIQVVQSFLNSPEVSSPNFFPGAWVLVMKVAPGTSEWILVDAGVLVAVSFETLVNKTLVSVRVGELDAAT